MRVSHSSNNNIQITQSRAGKSDLNERVFIAGKGCFYMAATCLGVSMGADIVWKALGNGEESELLELGVRDSIAKVCFGFLCASYLLLLTSSLCSIKKDVETREVIESPV